MADVDMPPLAHYSTIGEYKPLYGDLIIWSGWFSVWFGVVTEYNQRSNQISVIFEGLPYLLFIMPQPEYSKNIRTLSLDEIKRAPPGKFSVLQHDPTKGANVWYV